MISFRYHVVSIAAVLLALAAGVALGGGPLSEIGRGAGDAATQRAEERAAELTDALDRAQATAAFQDGLASSVGLDAIEGRLARRPVSIVTLPGADQEIVDGLADMVTRAGGSVAGTYAAQPALVDPQQKSLVDTLGAQVLETLPDTGVEADAATYERMGQLIGRAVATTEDRGAPVGGPGEDILSSLRGAELLTVSGGGQVRGSLVLVVLGDQSPETEGIANIIGGLATGIGTAADGLVIAGTTESATVGVLGLLRDEVSITSNVSSVDSVQTASGRVAAVLALAATPGSDPGHYGAVGIDGAVPRG